MRTPAGTGIPSHDGAGSVAGVGQVQRKCATCQEEDPAQRDAKHAKLTKRSDEEDEVKGKFTASPPAGAELDAGIEHSLGALGPGEPLPASERAFFEPRFGHDFGRVRVHAGPPAAGVAQALNARALTRSQDIVFASGQYAPGTTGGRHLIAHELAHVVQQRGQIPTGASGASGRADVPAVQRDLATPEPATPPAAQPDLTDDEIKRAITFNRLRFNATSTRLIQDLVGTEPTGTWIEDDIRAIAAVQEQFGLKKDGMVGDETFKFLDKEVSAEKLDRSDAHCLVSFSVFAANPVVGPVVGGSRSITVRFTMHARFPAHCRCPDYEYRQFIRGHWRRERAGVVTDLGNTFNNFPGGGGLPAAFAEDGNVASAALNYGHRNQTAENINHYLDDTGAVDQANGCRYEGEDVPGGPDNVLPGDVFDIELNFRGEIQRRGRVVTSQAWTPLRGRFPVP
jgi:hypothetical protein